MVPIRLLILTALIAAVGCSNDTDTTPPLSQDADPAAGSNAGGWLALEVAAIHGSGRGAMVVTSDIGADMDLAPERWRFVLAGAGTLPAQFLIAATDPSTGTTTALAITTALD